MSQANVTIVNRLGVHARAAAKFIDLARTFSCDVRIGHSNESLVDGKRIMKVLQLEAAQGAELLLVTDGDDQEQALESLAALIADRFGEAD